MDRQDKLFNVSEAATCGWGKETNLREIAKCDVMCANCHRIEEWERKGRIV